MIKLHIRQRQPRFMIGISLLVIQLLMIVVARFSDARYFCWAPHDSQNEYRLIVTINEHILSPEEVYRRYRIPQTGLDPRAIQHIKDIVTRYEKTYGKSDSSYVIIKYKTNGIEQPMWYWQK